MIRESEAVALRDGRNCVLRSAGPEDAGLMIAYMKAMLGETPFLLRTPEEFDYTEEQEAAVLARRRDDPRGLMLVAEAGGEIVASADVTPMGRRSRTLHRCTLGMSVRKDYWGVGLASLLMERLIAHAGNAGFEQIELEVVRSNRRALALYAKYGFRVYGTRLHGIKYADGSYANEYMMVRELKGADRA